MQIHTRRPSQVNKPHITMKAADLERRIFEAQALLDSQKK
jgi:hypothetical protein